MTIINSKDFKKSTQENYLEVFLSSYGKGAMADSRMFGGGAFVFYLSATWTGRNSQQLS